MLYIRNISLIIFINIDIDILLILIENDMLVIGFCEYVCCDDVFD